MWIIRSKSVVQMPRPRQRLQLPDVEVEQDTATNLVGANGVGKSTMLRILAGLERPHTGGVEYCSSWRRLKRLYLPCNLEFYSHATLAQNLTLFADLYGANRSEPDVDAMLYHSGLEAGMRSPVGHLSQGQRQAATLALVFIVKPDVAFIDEPFAHLDATLRSFFTERLGKLTERGTTLICTEVAPEGICTGPEVRIQVTPRTAAVT
jgi:ABC-type multidrug transport system ATPase subunit